MNIPKFYVGQRVVAIADHHQGVFKRGDCFTVKDVKRAVCSCGHYRISIGILPTSPDQRCFTCGSTYDAARDRYFNENRFAPIHEDFRAITFEKVLEKELTSAN